MLITQITGLGFLVQASGLRNSLFFICVQQGALNEEILKLKNRGRAIENYKNIGPNNRFHRAHFRYGACHFAVSVQRS